MRSRLGALMLVLLVACLTEGVGTGGERFNFRAAEDAEDSYEIWTTLGSVSLRHGLGMKWGL